EALVYWSEESRAIVVFADDKLKTIAASGRRAIFAADAAAVAGGTWNRDGVILFVPNFREGIYQVPASGGIPVPVIRLDEPKSQICGYPQFPAGRKAFSVSGWR